MSQCNSRIVSCKIKEKKVSEGKIKRINMVWVRVCSPRWRKHLSYKRRLRLFRHFDPFRILVCSGDGSVGWVLSEIDRLGMHVSNRRAPMKAKPTLPLLLAVISFLCYYYIEYPLFICIQVFHVCYCYLIYVVLFCS